MSAPGSNERLLWTIEYVTAREDITAEAKVSLMKAVQPCLKGDLPNLLQARMLVDSLKYTTKGFAVMSNTLAVRCFEALVTLGDLAAEESRPVPPSDLIACAYAECCLGHLRKNANLSNVDIELPRSYNFREALHAYRVDVLASFSPWLDTEKLRECHSKLAKAADDLAAQPGSEGRILQEWHDQAEILSKLDQYTTEAQRTLGPSFLELVARDIAEGRYDPTRTDGLLVAPAQPVAYGRKANSPPPAAVTTTKGANSPQTSMPIEVETAVERSKRRREELAAQGEDPLPQVLRYTTDQSTGQAPQKAAEVAAVDAARDRAEQEAVDAWAALGAAASPSDDGGHSKKQERIGLNRGPTARTERWESQTASVLTSPGHSDTVDVRNKKGTPGASSGDDDGGKQRRMRWDAAEEDELIRLVGQVGVGEWKQVLEMGQGVFHPSRTTVNLKDKWRNLSKFKHIKIDGGKIERLTYA